MRKTTAYALAALASGLLLLGLAHAQQTAPPAAQGTTATTPATKSAQNPPAKPAGTQATKPGTSSTSPKKPAPAPLVLKTDKDKASYAFGLNMGKGMKHDSVDLDAAIFFRGMKDGLAGGKSLLTDDEARAVITAFQTELRKQQQERTQAVGEANKKAADAFFAENKNKEGVVTLPSGLQYKILQAGDGPKPTATDTVVCNYKGSLLDNTEFDSSAKHGQPLTIPVNQVMRGWTEALQLMTVGSKWQLFIPPDLAYGAAGRPGIPPNSTLVFEVELLSIRPKPPVPAAGQAPGVIGGVPGAAPPPKPNPTPTPNPPPSPNPPPNPNPTPTPTEKPTPTPTPTPATNSSPKLTPNPSPTAKLSR